MFKLPRRRSQRVQFLLAKIFTMGLEPLEARQLLSASHHHLDSGFGFQAASQVLNKIEFSQAPAVVQTGLDTLATTDNLTDPTSTQSVSLDNVDGVETYSVTIDGTGTVATLTVDENGNAVTAPTLSTTAFGTLSGTGTGSDSAAASEISAIATALDLMAPTSTTTIKITTYSDGIVTYAVKLSSASGHHFGKTLVSVDGSGNPVGNQDLPFDVVSTAIQNALNSDAPTGAQIALATTSTQDVSVQTADGVTTFSTDYTVSGTTTAVTVNSSGQLTSLPSFTTTEFSDIPTAAQTELQTLANDYGVSGTISATQKIEVYTESSGTAIYAAKLQATKTTPRGNSFTYAVTIAVDEDGNPTTLPGSDNRGDGGGGGCDGNILDGGFDFGPSELFIG